MAHVAGWVAVAQLGGEASVLRCAVLCCAGLGSGSVRFGLVWSFCLALTWPLCPGPLALDVCPVLLCSAAVSVALPLLSCSLSLSLSLTFGIYKWRHVST